MPGNAPPVAPPPHEADTGEHSSAIQHTFWLPDVAVTAAPPQQRTLIRQVPQLYGWRKALAWGQTPAATPVAIFALSRALLLALTYVGLALLHDPQVRASGMSPGDMLLSWLRWDAKWFVGDAANGYATIKSSAFFPLMPLLMRLLGAPFADIFGPIAYFYAGMLIANAAFLGTLVAFHRLVWREFDAPTAQRATLLLALYPKALFTFTAYSEGLFLLLFILAYADLRQGRWVRAGILGALALLTRQMGVTLLMPFALELHRRYGQAWGAWLRNGWPALLMPLALVGYAGYLRLTLGDALAFSHAETLWKRALTFPLETLALAVVDLLKQPFGSVYQVNMGFDLAIIGIAVALLGAASLPRYRAALGIPPSALGLGFAVIALALSMPLRGFAPDLLSSTSRYLLAAFPVCIILARLTAGRPRAFGAIILASLLGFALFALGFVLGGYVI